jgi:hypothetical protein
MQADQLFLRTLEDLDRRTTAADEYEALLAAGLLRKLLLDETPLLHQVNRYRRERIRFRINGETPLERIILFARGERLSVADLIKQVAHIDGAVHKGKPNNPREELIDEMSRFMFFRNLPGTVAHVQLIGKITVRALAPLRDKILADEDVTETGRR